MRKLNLLLGFIAITLCANAQWNPNTATSGNIYYNGGHVGIGTSSPTTSWEKVLQVYDINNAALSVRTPVKDWQIVTDASGALWFFDHTTGTYRLKLHSDGTVSMGSNYFLINGNVGIGTSSPLARLHVKDMILAENHGAAGDNPNIRLVNGSAGTNYPGEYRADILLNSGSGELIFRNVTGKGYRFHNAPSTASLLTILDNGNVGIGSETPQARLDVAGNIRANSLTLRDNWDNVLESKSNGKSYQLIGTYQGFDPTAVYIAAYNASNDANSGTERVFIGSPPWHGDKYLTVNFLNGGVGIGTTDTGDPDYKLFVEKGIRTRKVKVDQVRPWPDYVFESGYQLPSLNEVEDFIKTNKHLPEVPSAKEVEKNGLDLGNNQAVLLKKIEELMLYAIEADKKNQSLQQENQQQKQFNQQLEARLKAVEAKLHL